MKDKRYKTIRGEFKEAENIIYSDTMTDARKYELMKIIIKLVYEKAGNDINVEVRE